MIVEPPLKLSFASDIDFEASENLNELTKYKKTTTWKHTCLRTQSHVKPVAVKLRMARSSYTLILLAA